MNNAPATNPCEIICNKAPSTPCVVLLNNPTKVKFMCATDAYATIRFLSVCRIAVLDVYTTATTALVYTLGVKYTLALGNLLLSTRIIPYVPNFNKIPALITDPPVGASTWASGNQICTGTIGTFTANEAKHANHNLRSTPTSLSRVRTPKLTLSLVPKRTCLYTLAPSNLTDPTKVYLKKKYAARTFRARDPHTPILLNIGIKTASKLT